MFHHDDEEKDRGEGVGGGESFLLPLNLPLHH